MGDIVLGVILLLALFGGYRQGIIKILGSVGAVLGGIILARRITPLVLPWLEKTFGWSMEGALSSALGSDVLGTLFFSQTGLGRLVEIVIFLVVVCVVVWLLRTFCNFLGNVINSTPLIGFVSQVLGALLNGVVAAVILFVCYTWVCPWLVEVIPQFVVVNSIFDTSVYVLPVIENIGYWVWFMAAATLAQINAGAGGAAV